MIWLTTDTHLGHDAMIGLCGRPKNHSEIILQNLRNTLLPGDILIHLGDVCFGDDVAWHLDLDGYVPEGVIRILIKGNHDHKSSNWYLNHYWNMVFDELSMTYKGKRISFTHIPKRKDKHSDLTHNIHGHLHNNSHRLDDETKKWYKPDYNKLLAIENTNYMPVTLDSML